MLASPLKLLSEGAALDDSQAIDLALGLRTRATEDSLRALPPGSRTERWNHLSPEVFQTPYGELAEILETLDPAPGGLLIDLGAGYARMGFLMAARRPKARFRGIEIVPERVNEARRAAEALELVPPQFEMIQADLSSVDLDSLGLEEADAYFTFDFGSLADVGFLFNHLKQVARRRAVRLVARGGRSRSQIQAEHPWLCEVVPPEHHPNWSFYRSGYRSD